MYLLSLILGDGEEGEREYREADIAILEALDFGSSHAVTAWSFTKNTTRRIVYKSIAVSQISRPPTEFIDKL